MVTISKLASGNVRVHIDCCLKSGPVRQYFEKSGTEAPSHDTDELPFVKILARAFVWKELLASGTYADKSALAGAVGICRHYLQQILHLPYLSPVVIEKMINGDLPTASLSRCWRLARLSWYDQHKALGIE